MNVFSMLILCAFSAHIHIFGQAVENGSSRIQEPLFSAIETNDLDTFKKLIEENPLCIHNCNRDDKTALHYAVEKGRTDMVASLLKVGALPNIHDKDGATPLYVAVYKGDVSTVKLLLEMHANPNTVNKNAEGSTPLNCAYSLPNSVKHTMAKMLLDAGANQTNKPSPKKTSRSTRGRKAKKLQCKL